LKNAKLGFREAAAGSRACSFRADGGVYGRIAKTPCDGDQNYVTTRMKETGLKKDVGFTKQRKRRGDIKRGGFKNRIGKFGGKKFHKSKFRRPVAKRLIRWKKELVRRRL